MSIYKPKSGIAFDIDGIILDTGTEIWNAVTKHLGVDYPIEHWTDYYIEKTLNVPIEKLRPVYEPILQRSDLPLVTGAKEVLNEFYDNTQEPILLITARRPQFVRQALESITAVVDVPFEIVGTSKDRERIDNQAGHDKTDYLKNHEIKTFIDDHPYSWEKYLHAGITVGTLEWPWTLTGHDFSLRWPQQFFMCENWDSMRYYLQHIYFNKRTAIV